MSSLNKNFILFNRCLSLALSSVLVAFNVCVSVEARSYAFTSTRQIETQPSARLYEQGEQQYNNGQYHQALIFYNQALDIYRTTHAQADIGETLYAIGSVHYALRQYSESLESYQQALAVYRDIDDQVNLGRTFQAIGLTYDSLGKYSESLIAYQQALMLYQVTHNQQGAGQTLYAIGQAHYSLGEYSAALTAYKQAIVCVRGLGDRVTEGATFHSIGIIYNELGEYSQALHFYEQALDLLDGEPNAIYRGQVFTSIGLNYVQQRQYQQAIPFYQQALGIYQATRDRLNTGRTLNNLGEAYQLQGQYQQALNVLTQALEIAQALNDRAFEGPIFDTLGSTYRHLGRSTEALEVYQKALTLSRAVNNRPSEAITLGNIGSLLSQQQPELAIVFYKQSVNVTETIRNDIRQLSQELQQSYTNTIADTYRNLSNLLLIQGRILEAQQVLELLKLQELHEFTGVRATVTSTGIEYTPAEQAIINKHGTLIALGQRVQECQETKCSQLTTLLDQREQLTQQFNQTLQDFESEMRARLAQDRGALDTQDFSRSAREIVEAQPRTVMIYAVVLDDKLWLLWATAGGIVNSVEVPVTRQKLGEAVLQFRQLLSTSTSDISQVQATAKHLYDWLIAPIAPELQKNHIQHLVFSLDRVTRYIPMAALFDGQHYLLENYTVSTVLSADLTRVSDRLPSTDQTSVLALGLSNAVPPDFPGLPNVPAELDAIVRSANDPQGIYPGLKFLNQQFDDHTLRDNVLGHQIVHIATHGVFVPGRQDQSYLVLGNGNHMSISSIQDLQDLGGVRLVVLSACQTALGGPDQDGLEIAGIAYYFLNGGVNTVMASLWSVNDASTQQLMQHLYRNLAQSTAQAPITRAEALRQAQLSLLQGETNGVGNAGRSIVGVTPRPSTSPATPTRPGLSHPYYWAPFILIGNGL